MYRFKSVLLFFVLVNVCNGQQNTQNLTENEIRPYEFTFNIADFQHRSEKRDDDGLISGEYGFITADGIYHETAYTTNKEGDFIVTKMKHRKVLSLKDAVDIYKDKPEQAKILEESMKRPCADCETGELDRQESASFIKVETTPQPPRRNDVRFEKRFEQVTKEMMKILNKKLEDTLKGNAESLYTLKDSQKLPGYYNRLGKELNAPNKNATYEVIRDMIEAAKKTLGEDNVGNDEVNLALLEKMANDLFYKFNFTSSSHSHWEDGFRDGRKDGEFNAKFKDGIDTHVKYTSNEFGYQPNITLVPRQKDDRENIPITKNLRIDKNENSQKNLTTTEKVPYKGYYFNWLGK
ncbi:uncharacterized protein LOC106650995 [Trichogramma pretiosum]|uniref:uncharacterized protein LOC106650995 n=1 Tax=Trichogramma pretiosum TaxID=7493 RepID=UPI000C71978E|nr:uncharacterized protein LOC106650995 [Trichogramma pretiosum]